jgi:mannose/fructose/N-acetylgalactosamine-specific phosphotransferase system component IID
MVRLARFSHVQIFELTATSGVGSLFMWTWNRPRVDSAPTTKKAIRAVKIGVRHPLSGIHDDLMDSPSGCV